MQNKKKLEKLENKKDGKKRKKKMNLNKQCLKNIMELRKSLQITKN